MVVARLTGGAALAALVACAAPMPPAPPADAATLAARLPSPLQGFDRQGVLPLPGGSGREVTYATQGRVAAAASIEMDEPAGEADGPDPVALGRWVVAGDAARARGATTSRSVVPNAGPPLLACDRIDGRSGRERVVRWFCAGTLAGAAVRIRVGMPDREPAVADPAAFVTAAAQALAAQAPAARR